MGCNGETVFLYLHCLCATVCGSLIHSSSLHLPVRTINCCQPQLGACDVDVHYKVSLPAQQCPCHLLEVGADSFILLVDNTRQDYIIVLIVFTR